LRKNFFYFHIFFNLVFNHDFVIYIALPVSRLHIQQLMTLQIRSQIEYLIQTYIILVLILYSKLMRSVAALAVFNTI